jgi:hypothetical protein
VADWLTIAFLKLSQAQLAHLTEMKHPATIASQSFAIPSVSVTYAHDGTSTPINWGCAPCKNAPTSQNFFGRGEQYLLIKSSPASGKSRALMFIALDRLTHQKLKQAIAASLLRRK